MLLEAHADATAFRPPAVEELTDAERRSLRAKLGEVVEGWPGGAEIGVQVSAVTRIPPGAQFREGDHCAAWYRTAGAAVALGLHADAAVRLLCANLGAPVDADAPGTLSELDLALLDAWAAQALPEVASTLFGRPSGEVLRPGNAPDDLAGGGALLVAELMHAGERAAGVLLLGEELLPQQTPLDRTTLGDDPGLLLNATLDVEALIATDGVPVAELLQIEPGDVLVVGDKQAVEARLAVGEMLLARARPGARSGVRALRITEDVINEAGRSGDVTDGC